MTCPEATSMCSVVPDGVCTAPKTYASLPIFTNIFFQGHDDGFTTTWATPISYPDYTVTLVYRLTEGGKMPPRSVTDRDDGTLTVTGLDTGTFYDVWMRVENPSQFGGWTRMKVLTDAAWNTDASVVTHLGIEVMHGGEIILH